MVENDFPSNSSDRNSRDDLSREDLSRAREKQFSRTEQRKSRRRSRRVVGLAVVVGLLLGGLLFAPTIVCYSGVGRSQVVRFFESRGWQAEVDDARVGWLTPISAENIRVIGPSGKTEIQLGRIDIDRTLWDYLRGRVTNDWGTIQVHEFDLQFMVSGQSSTLEEDLATLGLGKEEDSQSMGQETPDSSDSDDALHAQVVIDGIQARLLDSIGSTWTLSKSNAEITINGDQFAATTEGVLSGPNTSAGTFRAEATNQFAEAENMPLQPDESSRWQMNLNCETLPVSCVKLFTQRFLSADLAPKSVSGDLTGNLSLSISQRTGALDLDHNETASKQVVDIDFASVGLREFFLEMADGRTWINHSGTVNGHLRYSGNAWIAKSFVAETDFAAVHMDAGVASDISTVSLQNNPVDWLQFIHGNADVLIDIAALDRALPGLIPVRQGYRISKGKLTARVATQTSNNQHVTVVKLASEPIVGVRQVQNARVQDVITIPATDGHFEVADNGSGRLHCKKLSFRSGFGQAEGAGDLGQGELRYEFDLDKLSRLIEPLIQNDSIHLAGNSHGSIVWQSRSAGAWKLNGNVKADQLVWSPGAEPIDLSGEFDVDGVIESGAIQSIKSLELVARCQDLNIRANSVRPADDWSKNEYLQVDYRIEGPAQSCVNLPWMSPSFRQAALDAGLDLHSLRGQFASSGRAQLRGEAESVSVQLGNADAIWTNAALQFNGRRYSDPRLNVQFSGFVDVLGGIAEVEELTVRSNAISMAAAGFVHSDSSEWKAHLRADLNQLSGKPQFQVVQNQPVRPVGFVRDGHPLRDDHAVSADDFRFDGAIEGDLVVKATEKETSIQFDAVGANVQISELTQSNWARQHDVGPNRSASGNNFDDWKLVWEEPRVQINLLVSIPAIFASTENSSTASSANASVSTIQIQNLQAKTDWCVTELAGQVHSSDNQKNEGLIVNLDGKARIRTRDFAQKLTQLVGVTVAADGIHEAPLQIDAAIGSQTLFEIVTSMGWDQAAAGGLEFGPTTIPLLWNQNSIFIDRTVIPVLPEGDITIAGAVHQHPGPLWIHVEPNSRARNIRLTPEVTQGWLKYLAPVVVNAANINGATGLEIDEASLFPDDPSRNRIVGRLNLQSVRMNAGPMIDQILRTVDSAKMLADPTGARPEFRNGQTLVTMPPQTVEFAMMDNWVSHDRMYFGIDRAEVVSTGRVSTDGQLNLVVQIPLDPRWLGRDLREMSGRPIRLPVGGTLQNMQVDTRPLTTLFTEAVTTAGRNEVNRLLEKQLNRGLEKLFGK